MMTLTPSLPTGSPSGLPLLAERRIWAGAVARAADGTPRTGVLPAHFGPLVTGKASMGYNIAEFVAVTSRQAPGVEFIANDGTVDLSPAGYAAPTANSRLDVIWVRSRFTGFGDSSDAPEFGITQGAASPTPVKPSLPAGALELAVAEVKATDTTTQTVVIRQTCRYTSFAGGVVSLRSQAEQDAWVPADGAQAYRIDLGVSVTRAVGRWGSPFWVARRTLPYNLNGVNGAGGMDIAWDTVLYEGELTGFTTADWITFTCTVPGVYMLTAQAAAASTGTTFAGVFLTKNDQDIALAPWTTNTTGVTGETVVTSTRFAIGDRFKVRVSAGGPINGQTNLNQTKLTVNFLRA